jgi:hypothetical protein
MVSPFCIAGATKIAIYFGIFMMSDVLNNFSNEYIIDFFQEAFKPATIGKWQ